MAGRRLPSTRPEAPQIVRRPAEPTLGVTSVPVDKTSDTAVSRRHSGAVAMWTDGVLVGQVKHNTPLCETK